jgi:hypothetical protein
MIQGMRISLATWLGIANFSVWLRLFNVVRDNQYFVWLERWKCVSMVGVHLSYFLGRRMEKNRAECGRKWRRSRCPRAPPRSLRAPSSLGSLNLPIHLSIPALKDLCISRFTLPMAAISASSDSRNPWRDLPWRRSGRPQRAAVDLLQGALVADAGAGRAAFCCDVDLGNDRGQISSAKGPGQRGIRERSERRPSTMGSSRGGVARRRPTGDDLRQSWRAVNVHRWGIEFD